MTYSVKRDTAVSYKANRVAKKWIVASSEGKVIGKFRYKQNAIDAANFANSIERGLT